jgi:hypothetical protein
MSSIRNVYGPLEHEICDWTEKYLEEKYKHKLKFAPKNARSVSFTIDSQLSVDLCFDPSWLSSQPEHVAYCVMLGSINYIDETCHASALIYDTRYGTFMYIDPYSTENDSAIKSLLTLFKYSGVLVNGILNYPGDLDGIQVHQEAEGLMNVNDPLGYCVYWTYYIIDTMMITRTFNCNDLHANLVYSIGNQYLTDAIRGYTSHLIYMTFNELFRKRKIKGRFRKKQNKRLLKKHKRH